MALVEATETGCGRCHEPGGCGGLHAGKILCAAPRLFRARNPIDARSGDIVHVAVDRGSVRQAANLAYVAPLVLMVTLGGLADWWLAERIGQWGALFGAVTGLLAGWRLMSRGGFPGTRGKPELPEIVECETASAEKTK